jgi:phosphoribosylformylglycinamidine synthase
MPARLEIALKDHLIDAEGEGIRQKALNYFGMQLSRVRVIHILTIDAGLSADQLQQIQAEIFTNPVTQFSSFESLRLPFDWTIWVGYRPGVRDNPGATAVEAIEDLLGFRLAAGEYHSTMENYPGTRLESEKRNRICYSQGAARSYSNGSYGSG